MRILVDTNIFIDYFTGRDEESCRAAKLFFVLCRRFKNQTFVTSMSLRDIEYFAHKIYHDKEKSLKLLSETYSLCSKVIGISADAAIEAIYSNMSDFEDCLQSMAASEAMLDCIVTNNVKNYVNSVIPAFTPSELNKVMLNKKIEC